MDKFYTSKQMGDAAEMLVAAELTLAGVPALKVPDNWPGYDVVAQRPGGEKPLRISVKSRTVNGRNPYIRDCEDATAFDWLAIVLLGCDGERHRRIFMVPQAAAYKAARYNKPGSKSMRPRWHASKSRRSLRSTRTTSN